MKTFQQNPNSQLAINVFNEMLQQPAVDCPRKVDKPFMLYGAGNLGRMAKAYFAHLEIETQAVVDVNSVNYRCDDFWQNTCLLTPAEVSDKQKQQLLLVVCIATIPFTQICQSMKEAGWHDVVMFYDVAEAYKDKHPLSNGWFSGDFTESDQKSITAVLANWDDDISRAHHLQFLAYRYLRQDWVFEMAAVIQNNRYFIPELSSILNQQEIFVDVGAHHGEVVERFLTHVEDNYQRIALIEPDAGNLQQAKTTLQKQAPLKFEFYHCAVADKQGQQPFFNGLDYASQLCKYAIEQIDVITLDALAINASFIKLHLEGAELNALKGSRQILEAYRPIIVATSYHNRNGLWLLPEWMMKNLQNYRILMRMHSWCGTGAVVYAIPKERYTELLIGENG